MAPENRNFRVDLGDGLRMRRSSAADAEALAEFNKMTHRDPGMVAPDEGVAAWTRDLLRPNHPTFHEDDFTIVEEVATGRIVSSLNLISQTWSYAGIPFGVGRPELVGTAPEHRKRGLIRAQFDVIHAWSAARGELVQAITGIPFYYRQFGYEMAMVLSGGRRGNAAEVARLKEGEAEPYRLRNVGESDLPFVLALDAGAAKRSLVYCPRDEVLWRYELWGKDAGNVNGLDWRIIESAAGEPVGLLGAGIQLWGAHLPLSFLELAAGVSWLAVTPSLLRAAKVRGEELAARDGKTLAGLYFSLGQEHPLYSVTSQRLPEVRRSYAWFLRVPDLPAFIRRIAPALAARLARSVAAGHTGELKISFYRDGLRLVFEHGRLTAAEPWLPSHDDPGGAAFPGLTFLQIVFGYRSLDELRAAFPDCWQDSDNARALLEALFPKQPSDFWPIA